MTTLEEVRERWERRESWPEQLSLTPGVKADVKFLLEQINRLAHEVMQHQVGKSYEVGHEHGMRAGILYSADLLHQALQK